MRNPNNCLSTLQSAGFNYEDACALRRISMTLHRWHELECGDGNSYGSWCITRGNRISNTLVPRGYIFEYDDDGKPYLQHHHYTHGKDKDSVSYTLLQDRERGALKRLAAIMARYPGFVSYVQGDPRGCALYILRRGDLNGAPYSRNFDSPDFREWLSANYSRGIGVYK